jgi:hypothetical protein
MMASGLAPVAVTGLAPVAVTGVARHRRRKAKNREKG